MTSQALRFAGITLLVSAWLVLMAPHVNAAPRVVVSIKPVHSLVAALMAGVAAPRLLVSGAASPHGYALKPSDAEALAGADVVIWIGPALETSLKRLLGNLNKRVVIVELMKTDGLTRLKARPADPWTSPQLQHHEPRTNGSVDPHIWLDPGNARAIARSVVNILVKVDPTNSGTYAANAAGLSTRLDTLDRQIADQLTPVASRPFLVFHDAVQYLVHRYRLNAVGAVILNPSLRPGAKRLRQLRTWMKTHGVACVFSEPQFKSALINVVIEGTGARTGILDPLGVDLAAGPDHYARLMLRNARALSDCLSKGP